MTFKAITNLDEFKFMVVAPYEPEEEPNPMVFSAKFEPRRGGSDEQYLIEFTDELGKPQADYFYKKTVQHLVEKMIWVQPYDL